MELSTFTMQQSGFSRARMPRSEQGMKNRRCNALTLDLADLPSSLATAASDSPGNLGYQMQVWRPELANDDVHGAPAQSLISDKDQGLRPMPRLSLESFDARGGFYFGWEYGGAETTVDEERSSMDDSVNADSDEGWATRSPSPLDQGSSVPTTPESAPRRGPCRPLWDSFQKFSVQKEPALVEPPDSASVGGEPASAAAASCSARLLSPAEAIGVAVGPEPAAPRPILHPDTPSSSRRRPQDDESADTRADAESPSSLKRGGKFLGSFVTVVPITGRGKATCITVASTPSTPSPTSTPSASSTAAQEHEQSPSRMQQPPASSPVGAVPPAGSTIPPPSHEPSIAQQLHDALEDTIQQDTHKQPSNHTEPGSQWPLSAAAAAARPPDDEGPFNFSRPAMSRDAPRAAAPSPISTPKHHNHHYHPDILTPGKSSAPTSPTAAHFLGPTTPTHGRQELASGSSPRMQNPYYHGSGYPREPPRNRAADSTASFRSHCTASTAPPTSGTERSSVTRGTSVTSVDPSYDDEEPIVDEVMRMYEKGFYDDTDEEEEEEPKREPEREPERQPLRIDTRPASPASGYSLPIGTNPLTANPVVHSAPTSPLSSHPTLSPMPPSLLSSPAQTPPLDSSDISPFDQRPAFSPIPEDLPPVQPYRRGSENRDSGKSMGDCEKPPPSESLPPHSPAAIPNPEPVPDEDPESRDRYGFKKANQYITREAYDAWNATYTPYLDRRRWKWVAFMKENNLSTDHPNRFPAPSAKTKRFVRKGIPPEWRGAAWFYYAGGPAILGRHAGLYDRLLRKAPKPTDADIIERDLHRTFPDNEAFRPPDTSSAAEGDVRREDEPPMISALRRVLYAFSIHNPKIGYCQSLNFIAGLLLLFVPTEEQAFWLLNIVTQTLLPGTHETNLEGSKVDLGVLMTALRSNMPELWDKLAGDDGGSGGTESPRPGTARSVSRHRGGRRRDVTPITKDRLPPITITMAAWFMSCFIGTLPMEPTLRVWDVFFYEGSKTLFRAALAILKVGEAEISAVEDPMEMFSVVQGIPRKMLDANEVMETCFRRRGGFGGLGQGVVDDGRREMREGEAGKKGFFRRRRGTNVV